jgi:hypothetical protein
MVGHAHRSQASVSGFLGVLSMVHGVDDKQVGIDRHQMKKIVHTQSLSLLHTWIPSTGGQGAYLRQRPLVFQVPLRPPPPPIKPIRPQLP